MYKNYFYLNRLTHELDILLRNTFLTSTFSQEKNTLVLNIQNTLGELYLLINVSQNDPYIQYRKEFHRAKKNVTDVFRGRLPQIITGVSIAEKDRIIRFSLEKQDLFFFIRGKDTNIILYESGEVTDSFKKINEDLSGKIQQELSEIHFINEFYFPDFSTIPDDHNFFISVKNKFPFINKDILNESRVRKSYDEPQLIKTSLTNVIKSIYLNNIAVFYEESLQRMVFAPEDFKIFSGAERKIFVSYLDALNYFLISRFRTERTTSYKKIIAKNLDQQLSRISLRINEINSKLEEPSREDQYRIIGSLILANLYSIPKGAQEIELYDFNNEKVVVKLDEKNDAKKNADAYFEKAKNEKQSRISLSRLFWKLEDQYHTLSELKERFEKAFKNEDYLQIMAELKIKDDQGPGFHRDDSSAYRHFLLEKKYHVYVGKDSRNNDQLTTKFAKQNDYWFHARSVSGSHVVLRVENTKEVIPKSVLKKTAAIAAFYSKSKTSKLAPVAYTLKKYVVKRKGMEPGSVSLLKESVILVEPGIPEDCEYLNE